MLSRSQHRRLLSCSYRIYALLLYAYPAEFRRKFGKEMVLAFRDSSVQAVLKNGLAGWLRFLVHAGTDLMASTFRETLAATGWKVFPLMILAACCSGYSVLVDAHATEVQAPLLVIVMSAYLLSLASPKQFLLWSFLIGAGIPAKYFGTALLAGRPLDWHFLFLFLFALAAGVAGVVTRRLATIFQT